MQNPSYNTGGYAPGGAPNYPPAGGYSQPGMGYPQPEGGYSQPGTAPGYPQPGSNPGYPQPGVNPGYTEPGANSGFPGQPPTNPHSGQAPPLTKDFRENVNWDLEPSAPPMDKMDIIPGYDPNVIGGGELTPPSYNDAMRGSTPPKRQMDSNVPSLSEELAREALMQEVASHCCYGKSAAKDLVISSMEASSAFHYKLETFTEMRSTSWAVEPYMAGQMIDGPHNGPAPGPWQIEILPKKSFEDSSSTLEVPHTASVKPCHTCIGMGRVRCHHCHGMGQSRCTWCSGNGRSQVSRDGQSQYETCHHCSGNGQSRCTFCHGHGTETCRTCTGRAQLKCYIKLLVTWKNHDDHHIVERTSLPDNLIRKAQGIVAFEEQAPLVWPVNHFPEQTINQSSNSLVNTHRTKWPNERILMQRHNVRIVPVSQVYYQWKNEQGTYFVYGTQHLVHAPDYPQKCCWGCVIL